ncbi:hypothetical protein NE463_20875, partial [Anaerotruncus colihominis]|nr:hypothetical protein [Anaerotruncus colihominis]
MTWSEIVTITKAILQGLGPVLILFFVVMAASMPLGFLLITSHKTARTPARNAGRECGIAFNCKQALGYIN